MSLADELVKLQQLRDMGTLSETEFSIAKARLLSNSSSGPSDMGSPFSLADDQERRTRLWAFLLHLSHLCGYAPLPFAGFVAPVIVWQLKKEELPLLDVHGKNLINWIITKFLYAFICLLMCFFVIGFPMLIALGICDIIFTFIAAIKANNGEVWKYPGTIEFLK